MKILFGQEAGAKGITSGGRIRDQLRGHARHVVKMYLVLVKQSFAQMIAVQRAHSAIAAESQTATLTYAKSTVAEFINTGDCLPMSGPKTAFAKYAAKNQHAINTARFALVDANSYYIAMVERRPKRSSNVSSALASLTSPL